MSARGRLSAAADGGWQMSVEECLLSARADSVADGVARVRAAAGGLAAARVVVADAEELLDREIVQAARAGASVRALAVAEIARFGQAGWR
jgi:hypothetical protein